MSRAAFLAQHLFNAPVALHPRYVGAFISAMAGHGDMSLASLEDELDSVGFGAPRSRAGEDRGYDLVEGVAIINVSGLLLPRTGMLRSWWGITGYDGLRQAYLTAVFDAEVRAIVLNINSGGGAVPGCFDLVDTMFAARGSKPIWAILSENAYSAAYALASAADRIIVPRTGGTGSIGVISTHVDLSQMFAKNGVRITLVAYGAKKVDGNPEVPLSDQALADMQADVDIMGELFVETVARNRSLAASAIRSTEAGTYLGANGVRVGLADAVMAPDAAFRALLAELG